MAFSLFMKILKFNWEVFLYTIYHVLFLFPSSRQLIFEGFFVISQIKKFKDALAKHSTDRCSLGPPKGLEESELLALAGNRDLKFNYTPKPVPAPAHEMAEAVPSSLKPPLPSIQRAITTQESEDKALVPAGR